MDREIVQCSVVVLGPRACLWMCENLGVCVCVCAYEWCTDTSLRGSATHYAYVLVFCMGNIEMKTHVPSFNRVPLHVVTATMETIPNIRMTATYLRVF